MRGILCRLVGHEWQQADFANVIGMLILDRCAHCPRTRVFRFLSAFDLDYLGVDIRERQRILASSTGNPTTEGKTDGGLA